MRVCIYEGCDHKHYARDMCENHYHQWRKKRTPEEISQTVNLSARIEMFLDAGHAVCNRHGDHTEWSLRTNKHHPRALRCKPCEREVAKRWATAHPGEKSYYRTLQGKANGLLHGARRRAKLAGLPCTISWDWIVEQYDLQDGRCAYTGWKFDNSVTGRGRARNLRGMSLERVDPDEGYTPENTRLVCWDINRAKSDRTLSEFVAMCKAVAATL